MKKKRPVIKLTEDEKLMESEIARGEWKPVTQDESKRIEREMIEAARNQNKDARVNLRLNPHDVEKIREKAEREGVPYQTLIASILHKYATGQFLDEQAVRAVAKHLKKTGT